MKIFLVFNFFLLLILLELFKVLLDVLLVHLYVILGFVIFFCVFEVKSHPQHIQPCIILTQFHINWLYLHLKHHIHFMSTLTLNLLTLFHLLNYLINSLFLYTNQFICSKFCVFKGFRICSFYTYLGWY